MLPRLPVVLFSLFKFRRASLARRRRPAPGSSKFSTRSHVVLAVRALVSSEATTARGPTARRNPPKAPTRIGAAAAVIRRRLPGITVVFGSPSKLAACCEVTAVETPSSNASGNRRSRPTSRRLRPRRVVDRRRGPSRAPRPRGDRPTPPYASADRRRAVAALCDGDDAMRAAGRVAVGARRRAAAVDPSPRALVAHTRPPRHICAAVSVVRLTWTLVCTILDVSGDAAPVGVIESGENGDDGRASRVNERLWARFWDSKSTRL